MIEELRLKCVSLLEIVKILELKRENLKKACGVLYHRQNKAEAKVINVECLLEEAPNDEKLKMKLFDAQESYEIKESKYFHKCFQIEEIDRRICEISKRVHILMTHKDLMEPLSRCYHPICYHKRFYKGNKPTVNLSLENANYSEDICIECGKNLGQHKEKNQNNNPNWYKPNYEVIFYNNGKSLEEVQKYYRDICLLYPEEEVIKRVKEKFNN